MLCFTFRSHLEDTTAQERLGKVWRLFGGSDEKRKVIQATTGSFI